MSNTNYVHIHSECAKCGGCIYECEHKVKTVLTTTSSKEEYVIMTDRPTPASDETELQQLVNGIRMVEIDSLTNTGKREVIGGMIEEYTTAAVQAAQAEIEKAYGGCHNCYGKGYATVSDRWIGYDTDDDIGSPGGVIKGGKDFGMKFCKCDRGRQLKLLIQAESRKLLERLKQGLPMQQECDYHGGGEEGCPGCSASDKHNNTLKTVTALLDSEQQKLGGKS